MVRDSSPIVLHGFALSIDRRVDEYATAESVAHGKETVESAICVDGTETEVAGNRKLHL